MNLLQKNKEPHRVVLTLEGGIVEEVMFSSYFLADLFLSEIPIMQKMGVPEFCKIKRAKIGGAVGLN